MNRRQVNAGIEQIVRRHAANIATNGIAGAVDAAVMIRELQAYVGSLLGVHTDTTRQAPDRTEARPTWRDVANAYPGFVQWAVQRHGPLPDGPVQQGDYERLAAEFQASGNPGATVLRVGDDGGEG